jgi:hypothetical protein
MTTIRAIMLQKDNLAINVHKSVLVLFWRALMIALVRDESLADAPTSAYMAQPCA